MKTWKKIEEAKKRTGEIQTLKKRNEDKAQIENCRFASEHWVIENELSDQLRYPKAEAGWEEEDLRGNLFVKERGGKAV